MNEVRFSSSLLPSGALAHVCGATGPIEKVNRAGRGNDAPRCRLGLIPWPP